MAQFIAKDAYRATSVDDGIESRVDEALDWLRPRLLDLARELYGGQLRATVFFQLELALLGLLREFGRFVLELLLNGLEGSGTLLPHDMVYDGQGYRRLGKKTRNAHVATLFGTICLWRFPYRFWDPLIRETCIFPLELQLGLIEGVTPALADSIGRRMAEAGATQSRVLEQLSQEHGVCMGVKRLRKIVSAISEGLSVHRQQTQVDVLLAALQAANSGRGNRKPVLAVGRDGITLCEYKHRFWEVATTATVTVFDRAGKRLTTISLAYSPELGQTTMSQMITGVLTELFQRWDGPMPRLAYVADSGGNESNYFKNTLAKMRHPRTGERLHWHRVVDFYHAAERIWTMAELLFGKGTAQHEKWARRMLRLLKTKRRGANRVLHSAATFAARSKMGKSRTKEFRKAYNYIRKRTKWMQYSEYKKRHIPLGSGITEAACKTVFTQRLKLSGMRWTRAGAQQVLILRTILLSRCWQAAYAKSLATRDASIPLPYAPNEFKSVKKAA